MYLEFTHRLNQTALNIQNYLQSNWEDVNVERFTLEDQSYIKMSASLGNNNIIQIINDPRAIFNTCSIESFHQILMVNNIMSDIGLGEMIVRSYNILIYEFNVISIKQTIHNKNSNVSKYIDEEQCRKIADIGKRALYLLGLDYGMAEMVITGQRKVKVARIDSSPEIREKDLKVLLRKLDKIGKSQENKREIKIGADPEFMMANSKNGRMVSASEFFPREGLVGCDNIRIPSRQQRPIAEIRPKPDESPLQLLNNIKQALNSANKMAPYRNVKWVAGSQPFSGYSIGGHIHFSNVELNSRLMRALDGYVGLPIFLIENQETAVKRRRKYGFLADYRTKEYGGFEYRTPGSWLVSEDITRAVLCLAKIVASNYLYLIQNPFITAENQRAFYEGDQNYLRPAFYDIWHDIVNLEIYELYREHLKILPQMIAELTIWDEKKDIKKAWSVSGASRMYNNTRMAGGMAINRMSGTTSNSRTTSASNGRTRNTVNRSTSRSVRISVTGSSRMRAR